MLNTIYDSLMNSLIKTSIPNPQGQFPILRKTFFEVYVNSREYLIIAIPVRYHHRHFTAYISRDMQEADFFVATL